MKMQVLGTYHRREYFGGFRDCCWRNRERRRIDLRIDFCVPGIARIFKGLDKTKEYEVRLYDQPPRGDHRSLKIRLKKTKVQTRDWRSDDPDAKVSWYVKDVMWTNTGRTWNLYRNRSLHTAMRKLFGKKALKGPVTLYIKLKEVK